MDRDVMRENWKTAIGREPTDEELDAAMKQNEYVTTGNWPKAITLPDGSIARDYRNE